MRLTAFGVFWTGEGLGVDWPGDDLALPVLIVVFLVGALLAVPLARLASRDETPLPGHARPDQHVHC